MARFLLTPGLVGLSLFMLFTNGLAQRPNSTSTSGSDGIQDPEGADPYEIIPIPTPSVRPMKWPDIEICDRFYGEDLQVSHCNKAYDKLPVGDQFENFVTQKSSPAARERKVPFYYTDTEDGKIEKIISQGRI